MKAFKIWEVKLFLLLALIVTAVELYAMTKTAPEHEEYPDCFISSAEVVSEPSFCHLDSIVNSTDLANVIGAYSIINVDKSKPTVDNVRDFVIFCDAWYPDIVVAQYIIESNSGKSNLARNNNNLFGMRKAKARKTVRCKDDTLSGYATYNSWQLSVIDRIMWDDHMFKGEKPSRIEYLNKIKRIYAEDPNYIQKIEKIAAGIEC